MFKTSVVSITQLKNYIKEKRKGKIISGKVLLDLENIRHNNDEYEELKNFVVRSLILGNTTGKTTWENRFSEIDKDLCENWFSHLSDNLNVLDIGVSDGITSLDLFKSIDDHNISVSKFLISDLNENIFIHHKGVTTDIVDDYGNLIQFTIGPFSVPLTFLGYFHPIQFINNILIIYAQKFRKRKIKNHFKENKNIYKSYSLLHSAVQKRLNNEDKFLFKKINIFNIEERGYNFIRLFNVLNLQQGKIGFKKDEIIYAVSNIILSLQNNGLLLIGRTIPTEYKHSFITNATLFRKVEDNKLIIEKQYNKGTELMPILTEEKLISIK